MRILNMLLLVAFISGCSVWSETKAPCTYHDRDACGQEILINRE